MKNIILSKKDEIIALAKQYNMSELYIIPAVSVLDSHYVNMLSTGEPASLQDRTKFSKELLTRYQIRIKLYTQEVFESYLQGKDLPCGIEPSDVLKSMESGIPLEYIEKVIFDLPVMSQPDLEERHNLGQDQITMFGGLSSNPAKKDLQLSAPANTFLEHLLKMNASAMKIELEKFQKALDARSEVSLQEIIARSPSPPII